MLPFNTRKKAKSGMRSRTSETIFANLETYEIVSVRMIEMILVVDDNQDIVDWLREVVEGAGYYFDCATDSRMALYKMERIHYSMALIDLMMPRSLDGIELARRVKALPQPYCDIPLVAVTGGLVGSVDPALFVELLRKPFLPVDLLDIIKRCARPPIDILHGDPLKGAP